MKHPIKPFPDQTVNPAIDRNDPQAQATAIELQFPETFSKKAWRTIRYFEGAMYLYAYKGKFVATDESLDLTEYGDGSHERPYGAPRFVCDTLNELEQILEELADLYDDSGDIPGWDNPSELSKPTSENLSPNVLVKLVRSNQFIGVKTYCRKLGSHGRFLISQSNLQRLADSSVGTTRYEEDCGDYVKITRLENSLHFSFAWLNTYGDGSVRGNRQDIAVPLSKIRLILDWKDSQKYLYVPPMHSAAIDARPAASVIREIELDKRVRDRFRDGLDGAADQQSL